jgi:hypothetical protein
MPKIRRILISWHKSGKMNLQRKRKKYRRKKSSML